jgi:hypothetical protein
MRHLFNSSTSLHCDLMFFSLRQCDVFRFIFPFLIYHHIALEHLLSYVSHLLLIFSHIVSTLHSFDNIFSLFLSSISIHFLYLSFTYSRLHPSPHSIYFFTTKKRKCNHKKKKCIYRNKIRKKKYENKKMKNETNK